MGITTKEGDGGTTGLGSGERVGKDDPRIEAIGAVDELASYLGFARLACALGETREALEGLQRDLVRAAAEIARAEPGRAGFIGSRDEEAMTARIGALESRVPILGFVLPGRTEASARIDLARTSARTLERRVIGLAAGPRGQAGSDAPKGASAGLSPASEALRRWLNRLSDYLFMLARAEESAVGKVSFVNDGPSGAAG
jgi:cob(I)alamin adenosyltransferase